MCTPPALCFPQSPYIHLRFSFFSTTRPVSQPMVSPNSLLSMNISAAHTPRLHRPMSTRSKVHTWDGEEPNETYGLGATSLTSEIRWLGPFYR